MKFGFQSGECFYPLHKYFFIKNIAYSYQRAHWSKLNILMNRNEYKEHLSPKSNSSDPSDPTSSILQSFPFSGLLVTPHCRFHDSSFFLRFISSFLSLQSFNECGSFLHFLGSFVSWSNLFICGCSVENYDVFWWFKNEEDSWRVYFQNFVLFLFWRILIVLYLLVNL